jgi:hypothetical protein
MIALYMNGPNLGPNRSAGLKQTNSEDLGVYRSLPHVGRQSSWRSLIWQGKHLSLSFFDVQSEHLRSHTSHTCSKYR